MIRLLQVFLTLTILFLTVVSNVGAKEERKTKLRQKKQKTAKGVSELPDSN